MSEQQPCCVTPCCNQSPCSYADDDPRYHSCSYGDDDDGAGCIGCFRQGVQNERKRWLELLDYVSLDHHCGDTSWNANEDCAECRLMTAIRTARKGFDHE